MEGEFGGQVTCSETEASYSNDTYMLHIRSTQSVTKVSRSTMVPSPKSLLKGLPVCDYFSQKVLLPMAASRTDVTLLPPEARSSLGPSPVSCSTSSPL